MKFNNNSTDKQSRSRWIGWLSPMIAASILGLSSGSFGYFIAGNKTFFQDSKADAIRIPTGFDDAAKWGAKSIRSLVRKKLPQETVEAALKQVDQLSKSPPQPFRIPKKFQAFPIIEDIIAYRVPGVQASENLLTKGQPLKLDKNKPLNVTHIVRTKDNRYWLELYSSTSNTSVYIEADKVLCDIPTTYCLGTIQELIDNPGLINVYASKLENQIPLGIGW